VTLAPAKVTGELQAVRTAVRRLLDRVNLDCGAIAVASSGGADSLALAAATVHCAQFERFGGLAVHALVVDHGLQPDSGSVAGRTAGILSGLGCASVQVLVVSIDGTRNIEAGARAARYAALRDARPHPDSLVLLGHTLDDQAETVLLGLGRGSGPRSIAGMRELDPPWARPLLGIRRRTTRAACAGTGLPIWDDPHNLDPRFRRVRLRTEVMPMIEDVLAGGVAEALARTAAQLREDCDALDALAAALLAEACDEDGLSTQTLGTAPAAVRRRALRSWLLASGVTELSDAQLRAVDALVDRWHGQGGVALPGHLVARRARGRLLLVRPRG
jgi:tRNA(Ile)-lysidine synthase